MKIPNTLPRVPVDDDVRKLLRACSDTFEGRRNRALIALLADSGLRISETLHLRIEDVNFGTRSIARSAEERAAKMVLASLGQRPLNISALGWESIG